MVYAVIIAGGHGERFWPQSRFHRPKQLLAIAGAETMLQVTVKRIEPVIPLERVYVVTSEELAEEVAKQLPGLPKKNIIGEPVGRNTAAAIGLAAVCIGRADESATMAVFPADHLILDEKKFLACLSAAIRSAEEKEALVVFGITPDRAETGYGYIKAGQKTGAQNQVEIYEVEAFVEKPDQSTAKEFLMSGRHYWNSGMFVWTHRTIMGAMRKDMPHLFEGLQKIRNAGSGDMKRTMAQVYGKLEDISIDYGVMEKAANSILVKGDFRWDDVGSWLAMERIWTKDSDGNVSQGEFTGIDTHDSIIAGGKQLIAAVGLSNMIVVATDDAILICPKERAQEVKDLVKKLLKDGSGKYVE